MKGFHQLYQQTLAPKKGSYVYYAIHCKFTGSTIKKKPP